MYTRDMLLYCVLKGPASTHSKSLERKGIRIDALYGISVLSYARLVPHQKIHDNCDLLFGRCQKLRENRYTMLLYIQCYYIYSYMQ